VIEMTSDRPPQKVTAFPEANRVHQNRFKVYTSKEDTFYKLRKNKADHTLSYSLRKNVNRSVKSRNGQTVFVNYAKAVKTAKTAKVPNTMELTDSNILVGKTTDRKTKPIKNQLKKVFE
jgi:hypothetical protein